MTRIRLGKGVTVGEDRKGSGIWYVFVNYKGKRKKKAVGEKKLAVKVGKEITKRFVREDLDFMVLTKKNNEITSKMVSDLIISKIQKEKLRSETVKNIKNCLSAILQYACHPDEYISRNPARDVRVPRPEEENPIRNPDPFSWEERDLLEEVFRIHFSWYYPFVVAGSRTGLRVGELIALQWQDIDFHNKLIKVRRNIVRGKITSPKSKASKRDVRMTRNLVNLLREHQKSLKEEKMRSGWKDLPEWVFPNHDGRPLNYFNFIDRIWNRAMEKSGLRRRTPHDMRHTYATLRLSAGHSLDEVSKEMGHASVRITYETHYHWLPKESRSDIDELDGATKKMSPAGAREVRASK